MSLDALKAAIVDRYRIEEEIGAGGMATVYLAHDVKHNRKVALKILRPDLGAVLGTDRFLSEIRISAGLDHPHILTLIDSGVSEGLLYYVLPYVRGDSLRARLDREKQLGIEEALSITRQVASALDYAHRQGLVHRDIKPENILFLEGEAMLADFGIALAVTEAGGHRLTETGLSLGTPQYMSPEQATGDRVLDARSDIYSLGAVLYEMLTGEPPVTGATAQAMIAKLMTERPMMIRTVRSTVPVALDATVAKALAKIPADRHASAAEFSAALDAAMKPIPTKAAVPWRLVGVVTSAIAIAGVAIALFTGGRTGEGAAPQVRVGAERQVTFDGDVGRLSLSPDGRTAAYLNSAATAAIAVDLDGGGTQVLFTAPEGTKLDELVWSPDGSRLYVVAFPYARTIWSLPRLGGAARIEVELPHLNATGGKVVRRLASGEWQVVTVAGQIFRGRDPAALRTEGARLVGAATEQIPGVAYLVEKRTSVSSDERWLGYVGADSTGATISGIVELRSGEPLRVVATWDSLEVLGWAAADSMLYLVRNAGERSRDLLEVPFNPVSGTLGAEPVVIYPRLRATEAAVTPDGRRLVFTGGSFSTNLREITLDGTSRLQDNPSRLLTSGTAWWVPVIYTPTGELLAVLVTNTGFELFRFRPDGSRESQFSRPGAPSKNEMFGSPDGTKVAWVDVADPTRLIVHDLQARSDRIITMPIRSSKWSFSADGARLAAMSDGDARRMLVVDSGATAARILDLDCRAQCEFANEYIDIGPEWPWAVITSEVDLWVANLETGALRQVADETWGAIGWRGPWLYFYRTIGQTGAETPVMFRVPAAGGKEERVLDMPLECGQQPLYALSRDARRWTCAAVNNLLDITVVDIVPRKP